MMYEYKTWLSFFKDKETLTDIETTIVSNIIKSHPLKEGSYQLNITHKNWNIFRIESEIDRCRITSCLYVNLIKKPKTQYVSRKELEKWVDTVKPYDICVEIIELRG